VHIPVIGMEPCRAVRIWVRAHPTGVEHNKAVCRVAVCSLFSFDRVAVTNLETQLSNEMSQHTRLG
jgi:hypothetical protein